MSGAPRVRAYRPEDRARVREICHRTGYMGEPADWYWRDAESFADIWTAWYTDHEPESCLVVEWQGRAAGYLTGCVDTARAARPAAEIRRQILRRWLLLRPGTAGFLWRGLADTLREGNAATDALQDPRYPAHLHIDLLPEVRGQGMGAALMRAWLERLRALGSPGCHLITLAENASGVGFFRAMGFEPAGPPVRVAGMRTREAARLHQLVMVQALR